jgi:hypothetical protein
MARVSVLIVHRAAVMVRSVALEKSGGPTFESLYPRGPEDPPSQGVPLLEELPLDELDEDPPDELLDEPDELLDVPDELPDEPEELPDDPDELLPEDDEDPDEVPPSVEVVVMVHPASLATSTLYAMGTRTGARTNTFRRFTWTPPARVGNAAETNDGRNPFKRNVPSSKYFIRTHAPQAASSGRAWACRQFSPLP